MSLPIVPHVSPPTRWRWGWHAMVGAFAVSWAANTYYGGKAGIVVLLVLLTANGIAIELGRRRMP